MCALQKKATMYIYSLGNSKIARYINNACKNECSNHVHKYLKKICFPYLLIDYYSKQHICKVSAFFHLSVSSVYCSTVMFQDGNTLLHKAVRRSELELVELLLEFSKIDLNQRNKV